jgi:hypothetical protein
MTYPPIGKHYGYTDGAGDVWIWAAHLKDEIPHADSKTNPVCWFSRIRWGDDKDQTDWSVCGLPCHSHTKAQVLRISLRDIETRRSDASRIKEET